MAWNGVHLPLHVYNEYLMSCNDFLFLEERDLLIIGVTGVAFDMYKGWSNENVTLCVSQGGKDDITGI